MNLYKLKKKKDMYLNILTISLLQVAHSIIKLLLSLKLIIFLENINYLKDHIIIKDI